jgi:hypothetical protein
MLVHGGQNENNEYLNDTYLLSFSPVKWHVANIHDDTKGPYLAGHASAFVLPSEMKLSHKMNVYKYPDVTLNKNSTKVLN